ncbi:hypothetical protein QL285_020468 [Trifolium repens]|nr:hypothetical protein QL285_020468 [Trifolium repens]
MDSSAPCLESRLVLGVLASFGVISSAIIVEVALLCIAPSFVGLYFCLLCCILIFCFPSVFLTILKDWVMLKYWCHREDGGRTRPRENNVFVATLWRFLFFFQSDHRRLNTVGPLSFFFAFCILTSINEIFDSE